MDLQLKGKNAIVLGGTRGIGRAIAEELADEGCNVAICARNDGQIREAVEKLSAKGVSASGAAVDIADHEALGAWVAASAQAMGGLDILVSNASALVQGADAASWQKMLDVDMLGAVTAVDAALPFLKEAAAKTGDASIVAISSVSSVNSDSPSSYGAMKAALIHYMRGVAKSQASAHVRANVVSPGTVYFKGGVWHMVEENMPEMFENAMSRNPTGRMAAPEDISHATVFLASPLSSFTTGINMVVDGAITNRVNF
ncbi:MAG: SDR family oxidoreductase [Alphaproteobacteria bacterium]|nr:MAG: SDR family oxidoreductase [Alphaproteobacteria bacterium]